MHLWLLPSLDISAKAELQLQNGDPPEPPGCFRRPLKIAVGTIEAGEACQLTIGRSKPSEPLGGILNGDARRVKAAPETCRGAVIDLARGRGTV